MGESGKSVQPFFGENMIVNISRMGYNLIEIVLSQIERFVSGKYI